MELMVRLRLIFTLAARNVWLHRGKSLAIASLLGVGTAIMTLGLSLLTDVDHTMEQSIINSVAGNYQIYSAEAKDDLALFGGSFMGKEDIGTIEDFAVVRDALNELPEVKDVIPMGIDTGILGRGNELDDTFDSIRSAMREHDKATLDSKIASARQQIDLLKTEVLERDKVSADKEEIQGYLQDIARVQSDDFWQQLRSNPEENLMFLESHIAPASGEKSPIYLRYLGTDVAQFAAAFKKFKIVSGEMIPEHQRGMLIAYKTREDYLKNIAARLFDKLHKMVVVQGRPIASDPEAARYAGDLARQYLQLQLYIDAGEVPELRLALAEHGIKIENDSNASVTAGLQEFLKVDDTNFRRRYDTFYGRIAPMIKLYEISPGDSIVVRGYTRSGYIRNVAVKVFGIFSFSGIENSDLAGSFNLIDLVSFRELYGKMDATSLAEIEELRKNSGVKQVNRESAESELFGTDAVVETQAEQNRDAAPEESLPLIEAKPTVAASFPSHEIYGGLALNLAVKTAGGETILEQKIRIEDKFREKGLNLKVVDWKEASGFVGQFVTIIRVVLITSVVIILIVALVIINNTLVIAVFNRVREIGTMRALGAQRSFVMSLFLAETAVIGSLGAALGLVLSVAVIRFSRDRGIPAPHEVVEFLFGGPRLFPEWHGNLLAVTPLAILAVAVLASTYTARYAAAVSPSEAMQDKE